MINILSIDNSREDAEYLGDMLRKSPDERVVLERVQSVDEALRRISEGGIRMVMLEPDLEGHKELSALRDLTRRELNVPIVIYTRVKDEAQALEALRWGAQEYLLKGVVNPDSVHRVIRYTLERHIIMQNLREKSREVEEGELRFRNIIEKSADGVVIVDRKGFMYYLNPAAEKLFGRKIQLLIGKLFGFRLRFKRASEHNLIRSDGESLAVELRAVRIDWPEDGSILVTMRDITERKQLQEQFHQAQKMESIGRLAGGIAHDFNNIMTSITACADYLLNTMNAKDPGYEAASEIRDAAEDAGSLAAQILAFSHRQVTQRSVTNLNQMIDETHHMVERLVGENIHPIIKTADDLHLVKVDLRQMRQVLVNLVVNACDAMPKGGDLIIETRNVRREGEDYVELSVKDNGVGMTEEVKEHLFEPFFTTKEEGKGTGLGLASSRGLVETNEGTLEFDSNANQGTTFKVYFKSVGRHNKNNDPG